MAGALALVFGLTVSLIAFSGLLVVCFHLARNNGQGVKSVSWSLHRGIAAEFYPRKRGRNPDRTAGKGKSERKPKT